MSSLAPLHAAEQAVVIEAARLYVAGIGPIDMTNNGTLAGHLMAAETLLIELVKAFEDPAEPSTP